MVNRTQKSIGFVGEELVSWEENLWLLFVILTNIMWIYFSTALFIDRCAHIWVGTYKQGHYQTSRLSDVRGQIQQNGSIANRWAPNNKVAGQEMSGNLGREAETETWKEKRSLFGEGPVHALHNCHHVHCSVTWHQIRLIGAWKRSHV